MKIRSGFVSNSSSSSFVIIVAKDVHDKALADPSVTDYFRAVIEAIMDKNKIFGVDCYSVGNMEGMSGYSTLFGEGHEMEVNVRPNQDEETHPGDILWIYKSLVRDNGGAVFQWSADL